MGRIERYLTVVANDSGDLLGQCADRGVGAGTDIDESGGVGMQAHMDASGGHVIDMQEFPARGASTPQYNSW